MSGASVMILVRRRLLVSHKIEIVLNELETLELDRELGETECAKVIKKLEGMSDDELYALVQKIRRKKKVIAGVS